MREVAEGRKDYCDQTRFYGEGEIRIGTSLNLNLDIYSLGFISQLSDAELSKTLDIITGELIDVESSDDEKSEDSFKSDDSGDKRNAINAGSPSS